MKKKFDSKIVIVAPLPILKERVRLNKLTHILINLDNVNINFWGWDRGINKGDNDFLEVNKKIILKGGGENNKKLAFWYVIWMIKVFYNVLLKKDIRFFYCLGLESAFPLALINIFIKRSFIFDNPDNLSKSHKWPKFLEKLIEKMEEFTADKATIHIVPGKGRVNDIKLNTRIIPNTPASFLLEKAKQIAEEKRYFRGDKLTIYVNGYLTNERGMKQIYNAIKAIDTDDIEVILAGYIRAPIVEELMKFPNVTYYGILSNEEALALYYKCHFCFTYYEPTTEVNLYAEPNKWGDCISTLTPFITNSEILTAKEYLESGVCISFPYYDHEHLAFELRRFASDLTKWNLYHNNIKTLKQEPWDKEMKKILSNFLF